MGAKFCKGRNDAVVSLSMEDSNPRLQSALSSYEAACRVDPSLQNLDNTLHVGADRVIRTLAIGANAQPQSLTFDSLGEVTTSFLEMNHAAAMVILDSKEDIWKDKGLSDLVKSYFEHSLQVLDFFASFEKCLRQACDAQLRIQLAIVHFEKEEREDVGGENKYVKTLQELQEFKKEAEDLFTDEFSNLFCKVNKQQWEMLQKLQTRRKKLEQKLKSATAWRRVTNVIFVTAFVSTLIFSVVAVALAAPPVVTALAAALAAPIGTVGKWCDSLWRNYRTALQGQKELIGLMNEGTKITVRDMDTIRVLVDKLKIELESMLQNTGFALGEEDIEAIRLGIAEIKKTMDVFVQTIDKLDKQVEKSRQEINMARTIILRRIMRGSSN